MQLNCGFIDFYFGNRFGKNIKITQNNPDLFWNLQIVLSLVSHEPELGIY